MRLGLVSVLHVRGLRTAKQLYSLICWSLVYYTKQVLSFEGFTECGG